MLNYCDQCGDQSQASFTGEKPPYVCVHCQLDKAEARIKELEDKEFNRVEQEGRDLDMQRLLI